MGASVIAPQTFEDEWFGLLSDREMVIWIGVFSRLRDDQGRFVENAALARARLFPYRDVPVSDIQAAFDHFIVDGRLHRYSDGTRSLLQIVTWWEHQHPQWAAASQLPSPEGWMDRVRTRTAGSYVSMNWDSPGGFARTLQVNSSGEPLQVNASPEPFRYACEPEPEPEPEPVKRSSSIRSTVVGDKAADLQSQAQSPVDTPPSESPKRKTRKPKTPKTCDGGEPCPTIMVKGVRQGIANIDPLHSGQLWQPETDLGGRMHELAAYICTEAQNILPALEREQREPACARMLKRAVERMSAAHAKEPIRNLPAYIVGLLKRQCLGDVIGDDLVEELRREASASYGKRDGEPVGIGAALASRMAGVGA